MSSPTAEKLRLDPSGYEREARQYAERVYRTLVALEPLYDVLHGAIDWLTSHQDCLAGGIPAYLLSLHSGTAKVEQVVAQILESVHV
jgi:hypothetical protein